MDIDIKNSDILILCSTKSVDDTTVTAETQYSTNFSIPNRKFCFSLHYNWRNSTLFVNATKLYHFTAKYSEIKKYSLCLENYFMRSSSQ